MNQALADAINDMVSNFLYYDRREDEELPLGTIESSIASKETSVNEIVEFFKEQLIKGLR